MPTERELLPVSTRSELRSWFQAHHAQADEVWVVILKGKSRGAASLTLEEAQEEALCFGWVDVQNKRLDEARYALRFTPRRAGSAWSISNIRRVEQLTAAGRMTEAGLKPVAEAQANGQWEIALRVEETDVIPEDLEQALRREKGALAAYRGLSRSRKRQMLRLLLTAKSPATRQRRIAAIVEEVKAEPGGAS
jgi:uncharacterized protein YdeI (YjbR/CyaY-like superfamily)